MCQSHYRDVPIYGRTLKLTDDDQTGKVTAGETASVYDTVQHPQASEQMTMILIYYFSFYAICNRYRGQNGGNDLLHTVWSDSLVIIRTIVLTVIGTEKGMPGCK